MNEKIHDMQKETANSIYRNLLKRAEKIHAATTANPIDLNGLLDELTFLHTISAYQLKTLLGYIHDIGPENANLSPQNMAKYLKCADLARSMGDVNKN